MIETIYRQKPFQFLTPEQQSQKILKDKEYEIAVQNLSAGFYQKKRSSGATKDEEESYKRDKAILWDNYYQWALSAGLYEEITPSKQLDELTATINDLTGKANLIRKELSLPEIKVV